MKHRKTKKFALQFLAYMTAYVPSYYFYYHNYDTHFLAANVLLIIGAFFAAMGGGKTGKWFDKKYPQS